MLHALGPCLFLSFLVHDSSKAIHQDLNTPSTVQHFSENGIMKMKGQALLKGSLLEYWKSAGAR